MGIIIDTSVFIRAERNNQSLSVLVSGLPLDDDVYISVVTISELLVGVYRANNKEWRIIRSAYVEQILSSFIAIEITASISRIHSTIVADLMQRGQIIGVQDMWIAATAIHNGFSVLTYDVSDFSRIKGLNVLNAN
jgi:predicted nucleic acid-binding protein